MIPYHIRWCNITMTKWYPRKVVGHDICNAPGLLLTLQYTKNILLHTRCPNISLLVDLNRLHRMLQFLYSETFVHYEMSLFMPHLYLGCSIAHPQGALMGGSYQTACHAEQVICFSDFCAKPVFFLGIQ